jgi:hypothetical protein
MPAKFDAAEMPRLDAFEDEFGQDPLAIQREQQPRTRVRFWTFVGVALGAGVEGQEVLALMSDLRPDAMPPAKSTGREASRSVVTPRCATNFLKRLACC